MYWVVYTKKENMTKILEKGEITKRPFFGDSKIDFEVAVSFS